MTAKDAIKELQEVHDIMRSYDIDISESRLMTALNMAIKALEQEPKWTPVSERLPEKNVEVLATTEWGIITIAERYSANDYFINDGATNADENEIIAWMLLPKPYEPQEQEE